MADTLRAFSVPQGYRKVARVEFGMTKVEVPELLSHFSNLPDPRKPRGIRHELSDIVVISILAVICGANTYSQIQQYALAQEGWLRTFLRLPSGIPSQDTFERIFAILNPEAWQTRFLQWTKTSPSTKLGSVDFSVRLLRFLPSSTEVIGIQKLVIRGLRTVLTYHVCHEIK